MAEKKRYQIYIGIDCGVQTGICVWERIERKIRDLGTCKIHIAMDIIKLWHGAYPNGLFVRVEDARQRTWIPKQKNEKAERGRREGAGSVKRDAKIWEDFLTELGIPFEMVAPAKNKTKVSAKYFKQLTGYAGRCSSHARDAAMLVVGF